jgi:hypothetical protein
LYTGMMTEYLMGMALCFGYLRKDISFKLCR